MKLTAQDYRNAIEVDKGWIKVFADHSFESYCTAKIAELEKPEPPMYKCIQLPHRNNGTFKLGKFYGIGWCCGWFRLSDLPKHFELVQPEPEKITMQDISNTLNMGFDNRSIGGAASEVIDRIKKDHFS